jgi:hypothetical protein
MRSIIDAMNGIDLRSPGWWVQLTGVVHAAYAAAAYRGAYEDIARGGVLDTVGEHGERATAFWFGIAAPVFWGFGGLLRAAERSGDPRALRSSGATLLAVGLVGVTVSPRSGFWSHIATGVVTLRRARTAR